MISARLIIAVIIEIIEVNSVPFIVINLKSDKKSQFISSTTDIKIEQKPKTDIVDPIIILSCFLYLNLVLMNSMLFEVDISFIYSAPNSLSHINDLQNKKFNT